MMMMMITVIELVCDLAVPHNVVVHIGVERTAVLGDYKIQINTTIVMQYKLFIFVSQQYKHLYRDNMSLR